MDSNASVSAQIFLAQCALRIELRSLRVAQTPLAVVDSRYAAA
jgi:hypothetical protein